MKSLAEKDKLTSAQFKDILCPVLIGIGSEDKMVSQEESKVTASELPNAKFQIFKDFQHPINSIDQDILCNALSSFIGKQNKKESRRLLNYVMLTSKVEVLGNYSTRFKPSKSTTFICFPVVEINPSFLNCDKILMADSVAVPTRLA